ncbi:LysR family transcriptional regulator [soil metagenome]
MERCYGAWQDVSNEFPSYSKFTRHIVINLTTIDLNLLRVFDSVMAERSITRAGNKLGLTQSATSNALKRLKTHCGDPLFVRTAAGMAPTRYATELAAPIAQALTLLRGAAQRELVFDPARSHRHFTILMADVGDLMFLPILLGHLRKVAPGLKIVVHDIPRERYGQALESGDADLALSMLPAAPRDFVQQRLFDEPLVCVARRDHPVIKGKLSRAQYMAAEHLVRQPRGMSDGLVIKALGRSAAERKVALEVQHYLAIPLIVQATDLLSIVPRTVAEMFLEQTQLQVLKVPFAVGSIKVRQYWHKRQHHDPGHRWLRAELLSLFAAGAAAREA